VIRNLDERNFRQISVYNLSYKTDIKSREIYILVLYLWFYCKDSHILIAYEVHTKFFLRHRTFENNVLFVIRHIYKTCFQSNQCTETHAINVCTPVNSMVQGTFRGIMADWIMTEYNHAGRNRTKQLLPFFSVLYFE